MTAQVEVLVLDLPIPDNIRHQRIRLLASAGSDSSIFIRKTILDAKQLFEILVRENSRMLLAFIRSIQYDQASAEDTWQETMLVAWRRIDDYDPSRPFGPWLRGIAQKIVLSQAAKPSSRMAVADPESMEYLSQRFESLQRLTGDTLDEKLEALRDCVALLPDHERQCIQMRYSQNLMPAELCERLSLALETVKKRLVRAKQRLIDCMTNKLEFQPSQGGA